MSPQTILLAILIMVIWGVHGTVIKIGVETVPPLTMLCLRLLCTGLFFLPFARLKKADLPRIFRFSFWLNMVHFPCVFMSLYLLDVSSATVIHQMYVPLATIWGFAVHKDLIGWRTAVGIAVSFLGILILFGAPDVTPLGFLFCFGTAMSAVLRDDTAKTMKTVNLPALMGYGSLIGLPAVIAMSFFFEQGQINTIQTADPNKLACVLAYQVLLVAGAHMLWQRLMTKNPISQLSITTMLGPVFAILSATLWLGETLSPYLLTGGTLVMLGVAIVTIRKAQKAES